MRDPKVEQVLNSTPGLEWEYVSTLPLLKVNLKKSHQNQARIDAPINTEWVRRYKEDKVSGDQFPAPVFFLDSGEYIVSDGNHRVTADTELGRTTTDGYVVICDNPTTRAALTFEWNTLIGHTATDEDTDRHVIYLMNQGETMKAIAAGLHLSPRRVEEVVAEDAGHVRAVRMSVKSPWARIPSRAGRVRLHRDLPMDEPFAAAVKIAGQYALNGIQVKEFTAEVSQLPSEASQLALIAAKSREFAKADRLRKEAEAEKRKTRRGGKGQPPAKFFKAHLSYVGKAISGDLVHGKSFAELVGEPLNEEELTDMLVDIAQTRNFLFEAERVLREVLAKRA